MSPSPRIPLYTPFRSLEGTGGTRTTRGCWRFTSHHRWTFETEYIKLNFKDKSKLINRKKSD